MKAHQTRYMVKSLILKYHNVCFMLSYFLCEGEIYGFFLYTERRQTYTYISCILQNISGLMIGSIMNRDVCNEPT